MAIEKSETQLLIRLPDTEYSKIEEFCNKSGMTKKAFIQLAVKNLFAEVGVATEEGNE